MSKAIGHSEACPQCGATMEFYHYASINVTIEPDLRERVLDDTINSQTCSNCGSVTRFVGDLLYHDMSRLFMVKFMAKASEQEKQEVLPPTLPFLADCFLLSHPPIVRDWQEFKATILHLEKTNPRDSSRRAPEHKQGIAGKIRNTLFKSAEADEPTAIQQEDLKVWLRRLARKGQDLPEILPACEELPGASGSFGRNPANPVPVNGQIGVTVYIRRLQSRGKDSFFYHRLGKTISPACNQPVWVYELATSDPAEWCLLYFSPYHPRRSMKNPEGIKLVSFNTAERLIDLDFKDDIVGRHYRIPNFPFSIPKLLSNDETLDEGFRIPFAQSLRELFEKKKGQWRGAQGKNPTSLLIDLEHFSPGQPTVEEDTIVLADGTLIVEDNAADKVPAPVGTEAFEEPDFENVYGVLERSLSEVEYQGFDKVSRASHEVFYIGLPYTLPQQAVSVIGSYLSWCLDNPSTDGMRQYDPLTIGFIWGEQICRASGWQWKQIAGQDLGSAFLAIVSPARSHVLFPGQIVTDIISAGHSADYLSHLFEMIRTGNLPPSSPYTYQEVTPFEAFYVDIRAYQGAGRQSAEPVLDEQLENGLEGEALANFQMQFILEVFISLVVKQYELAKETLDSDLIPNGQSTIFELGCFNLFMFQAAISYDERVGQLMKPTFLACCDWVAAPFIQIYGFEAVRDLINDRLARYRGEWLRNEVDLRRHKWGEILLGAMLSPLLDSLLVHDRNPDYLVFSPPMPQQNVELQVLRSIFRVKEGLANASGNTSILLFMLLWKLTQTEDITLLTLAEMQILTDETVVETEQMLISQRDAINSEDNEQ